VNCVGYGITVKMMRNLGDLWNKSIIGILYSQVDVLEFVFKLKIWRVMIKEMNTLVGAPN